MAIEQTWTLARTTTRRRFVAATSGLVASLPFITRVGTQTEATPGTSPAAGGFSFTDDKGVTVTLPERPTVIVADVSAAAPLWDFGIRPVAVSGWTAGGEGYNTAAWGNIDQDAVEVISGEQPSPDPEKLLALKPDLFVTITWDPADPENYWSFESADEIERVRGIVPILAISATGSAAVSTERFAELSAALGADLSSPEIADAKNAYDAAATTFTELVAAKSDLTTLFVYCEQASLYVAKAPDWADLAWYQSLGLNIIDPAVEAGAYWEQLSWEQALKYPADIVFNTTRGEAFTNEELIAHPTFGQHPAIKAGQIGSWNQDFIMSYLGLKTALDTMIATITPATKVT